MTDHTKNESFSEGCFVHRLHIVWVLKIQRSSRVQLFADYPGWQLLPQGSTQTITSEGNVWVGGMSEDTIWFWLKSLRELECILKQKYYQGFFTLGNKQAQSKSLKKYQIQNYPTIILTLITGKYLIITRSVSHNYIFRINNSDLQEGFLFSFRSSENSTGCSLDTSKMVWWW